LILAVVLAAGASSRFGSPKQRILLPRVLDRVRDSSVDDALVVLGAYEVETDARVVRCPHWERGPGASLRCGLEALPEETEAAVVILADGPNLDPRAIDRVIATWRRDGGEVTAGELVACLAGSQQKRLLLSRNDDVPRADERQQGEQCEAAKMVRQNGGCSRDHDRHQRECHRQCREQEPQVPPVGKDAVRQIQENDDGYEGGEDQHMMAIRSRRAAVS